MIIRAVFTTGGDETAAEMQKHVPDIALTEQLDVSYGDDGADTTMDVFSPASATGPLPTVVWIHGGAWISGAKENVEPYLRILAAEGYTTIGVDYTIGPEGVYPLAVHQLNDALAYIDAHADELGVDPSQIVLAGDSAGAQLASQMASWPAPHEPALPHEYQFHLDQPDARTALQKTIDFLDAHTTR